MLSVHLICVGKLKEKFYLQASQEYLKRLNGYCKMTLLELPEAKLPKNPTNGDIQQALDREGQAILAKIPQSSTVIALCVEGTPHSSEELATIVDRVPQNGSKHLVLLIGGSYGMHPNVKSQAQVKLSMSPMTFPHHLARVMLLEQIYRAFKINEGSSYHK